MIERGEFPDAASLVIAVWRMSWNGRTRSVDPRPPQHGLERARVAGHIERCALGGRAKEPLVVPGERCSTAVLPEFFGKPWAERNHLLSPASRHGAPGKSLFVPSLRSRRHQRAGAGERCSALSRSRPLEGFRPRPGCCIGQSVVQAETSASPYLIGEQLIHRAGKPSFPSLDAVKTPPRLRPAVRHHPSAYPSPPPASPPSGSRAWRLTRRVAIRYRH